MSLKNILPDFVVDNFEEYYPEYLSLLVTLLGIGLSFGPLQISLDSLSGFSAVITQVLAAYSGLLLTAYTVFQGLRLNSAEHINDVTSNLAEDKKVAVKDLLAGIHTVFKTNLKILLVSTLVACLIYFITCAKLNFSIGSFSAENINGCALSVLFGLFTHATLGLVATVNSLYSLRAE